MLCSENNCWVLFVKNILKLIGLEHVWLNQHTFSANRLKKVIQNKLEQKYTQFWHYTKNTKHKLEFYNKYSEQYRIEPYILNCRDIRKRKRLTNLKLSCHKLKIETGRYNNTKASERLCSVCNIIENELHFLDFCTKYDFERSLFISKIKETFEYIDKPSDCLNYEETIGHLINYLSNEKFNNIL